MGIKYTKTKVRIMVHKVEITAPVGCHKFDIRLPEGIKRVRAITVTTDA
jgi:hypothetical protein